MRSEGYPVHLICPVSLGPHFHFFGYSCCLISSAQQHFFLFIQCPYQLSRIAEK